MRRALVIGLWAALVGCGGSSSGGAAAESGGTSSGAETATADRSASFARAVDAALAAHADGLVIEVELENDEETGGRDELEVEMLTGTGVELTAVVFDPGTLAILSEDVEEPEADEVTSLPTLRERYATSGLDMRAGLREAFSRYEPATVCEVEFDVHDGRLTLEVTVERDGVETEYVHDVATLELLGVEDDTGAIVPAPP